MINNIQPKFLINFQGRKSKYTPKQKELAMRFAKEGLTLDEIVKISEKYPYINNSIPYTLEYNIREFVKLHAEDGLTVEQQLKAAKKQPSLFCSKPLTLSNKINDLYDFVAPYGITKKDIIKQQNTNPILRVMSAQTLIKNMRDIPERYKDSGLTEEEYVNITMQDNHMPAIKVQNFEKKINDLIDYYADLDMTEQDLIKAFKKHRLIITNSFKNVTEKIDSWRFIEENKLSDNGKTISKNELKDLILRKQLTHSLESNMLYLLRCKLNSYYQTKIPAKKTKESLSKFIVENSNKTFTIPVLDGKFTNKFKDIVSTLSKELVNKNIFEIVIK